MSKKRCSDVHPPHIDLKNISMIDDNFRIFLDEKIERLIKIIQNVIKSLKRTNSLDIFSNSELNSHSSNLAELYEIAEKIKDKSAAVDADQNDMLSDLQQCFDGLSTIMMTCGGGDIDDIIYVLFGKDYKILPPENAPTEYIEIFESKLNLIKNNVTYIGYKVIPWKTKEPCKRLDICSDKITEGTILPEDYNTLECFEPVALHRSFYYSTQGIRIVIQNAALRKTLILSGIVDNIEAEWLLHDKYIKKRRTDFNLYIENHLDNIDKYVANRLISTFFVKEYLLYSCSDVYKKYTTAMADVEYVRSKDIITISKKFLTMDIINQRNFIIHLLIYDKEYNVHYIAYILYDLLTFSNSASTDKTDSQQQSTIYNSFPFAAKMFFKDSMKNTIKFTNESLNKYDSAKINLEQQVLLLKVSDTVKDKANSKLKEIKGKPDEQTGKAKQYLEGLIKIPFNVYKKEPVLQKVEILNRMFIELVSMSGGNQVSKKEKYTVAEISQTTANIFYENKKEMEGFVKREIGILNKRDIINILIYLKLNGKMAKVNASHSRGALLQQLTTILFGGSQINHDLLFQVSKMIDIGAPLCKKYDLVDNITKEYCELSMLIKNINESLDSAIYAHKNAKTQILKVISQWINGEQNGYCFGFEGSPGIGKTSLAKRGLAQCLKDENGVSRPFAFIALGGSCNGSTLEGHSYTYVNSTWGKIVDTIMDAKCMNPIIYIDELDKVSKTEQGKEIIGILTHLIDYSQNDEFQDKYFSGIPIDLSKVLFIFSYNDPDAIDRVLLDRIHRIKFDNLSCKDKVVIVNKFILPEINHKIGFCDTVSIDNGVIEYIIETYTLEPGIRKLKEILYDLYGEINIELMTASDISGVTIKIPICITKEDLGKTYLKTYKKITEKKAHLEAKIGVINGLWANSVGGGGIIPIECMFVPSANFLELRLTGMQGDVMKESMNVAKTLAWSLTPTNAQQKWLKDFDKTKNQGIHLHCPEGAVSKDGPSAGAAITSVIYSLLNNKKIKSDVAITGEITLQGNVTAIGGLDLKIMGGIRAGIKTFIYPKSNILEYEECESKNKMIFEQNEIKFVPVESILEIFPIIFE